MPGGKVAFYTGILPICEDEAGVAVVMGHEVAHALARHGNERMSQALIAQVGMAGLSEALAENDSQTRQLWMSMAGLGVHYGVMLPFGRNQESEADRIGLILMAKAGYDPREAPRFWERMAQSGGSSGPAFMSTHPSHDTRISRLKKLLPEAMLLYRKADTQ